jgi:hypothetical protein
MDPQAAWQRMLDAYASQNWREATEAAEDLLTWLRGGGFPPQTLSSRSMDDLWNRTLAEAACRFVILEYGRQRA